jgi:hypothetical protein
MTERTTIDDLLAGPSVEPLGELPHAYDSRPVVDP